MSQESLQRLYVAEEAFHISLLGAKILEDSGEEDGALKKHQIC